MIQHIVMVYAAGGLTANEKHLLGAYCNHTDAHGYCWPGVPRLADETGMSERTVNRVNASLKAKKLIKAMHRFNPVTGEQITNLTRVNLDLLAEMERPPREYDDNLVEAITFEGLDDVETPSDLRNRQPVTPRGDNLAPRPRQSGTPRGANLTPKPSPQPSVETSASNSSSSVSGQPSPARDGERGQEEEGSGAERTTPDERSPRSAPLDGNPPTVVTSGNATEAGTLVDRAAAQWVRRPNAGERARLVAAVDQALAAGASSSAVTHGLTRDLETARNPVAVVTSRTRVDGWADHDPAAIAAASRPMPLPTLCGKCANRWIEVEDDEGNLRLRRCPTCHPNA